MKLSLASGFAGSSSLPSRAELHRGLVARSVIAFQDASTPRKPRKSAPVEQVELYKEQMKQEREEC